MIARIYIFIVLAIVLPDVYLYVRYLRHRTDLGVFQHMLWWVPGIIMTAYTAQCLSVHVRSCHSAQTAVCHMLIRRASFAAAVLA